MKQSRRWAASLAAMMIAASLVATPREGAAAGPFIDMNPPVIDEGDPDVPGTSVRIANSERTLFLGWLIVARAGQVPVLLRVPRDLPRRSIRSHRSMSR